MAGIVKIPYEQVSSFDTHETTQKLAHHFLSTLKVVYNVAYSGTEFCTFNPFVVGSTPAGPTKYKKHFVLRFKVLFSCPFVFDAALAASLVDHARVFYAAAFSTLCDPSLASECITQPKKCRTGQVRHREIGTVLFTALSMWLLRA